MTDQRDTPTPAERRAAARTWAGFRSVRISPQTGTTIVVVQNVDAGLDDAGGRYSTICDEHSTCIAHTTLALATYHAAAPLGWCETCMLVADGAPGCCRGEFVDGSYEHGAECDVDADHGAGCDGPLNCVCSTVTA